MSALRNKNVTLSSGKRTNMRLEPEMLEAIDRICMQEGMSLGKLVEAAEDAVSGKGYSRTSAVVVYVINYFRAAATEQGHAAAGHSIVPVHLRVS